jgi:hypothetical protein
MPTLEFEGKPFVYSRHLSVPFRELDGDLNKNLLGGKKPSQGATSLLRGQRERDLYQPAVQHRQQGMSIQQQLTVDERMAWQSGCGEDGGAPSIVILPWSSTRCCTSRGKVQLFCESCATDEKHLLRRFAQLYFDFLSGCVGEFA